MTNKELVLNMLAELSTKEISEAREPDTFEGHMQAAADGGDIARNARLELEAQTGKPVISQMNAKNLLQQTIFSKQIKDAASADSISGTNEEKKK